MATLPPTDTTETAAPEQEESSGGLTIEIKVGADGSMSVGVEPEGQEAAEAEAGESEMQPVASLPELFKLLKQIITQGSAPDTADQGEMDAGYNSRG